MKNEDRHEKQAFPEVIPEPAAVPRFVLLWHELETGDGADGAGQGSPVQGATSHWDLMLEQQASLTTFRLQDLPEYRPNGPLQFVPAKRIADHRPVYLDYEGEISGNRGSVRKIASGIYSAQKIEGRTRITLKREKTLATLWLDEPQVDEDFQLEVWNWAVVHH